MTVSAKQVLDGLQKTLTNTPRYLFRVSSSASSVMKDSQGFHALSTISLDCPASDFRSRVSEHLNWQRERGSPFISTTSSLLQATLYARWTCLQGRQDVNITMMDARLLDQETVYPAAWLVKTFEVLHNGRPWHDKPEGEYLVINHIPCAAFLGSTSYEAMHQQIETLIPELADKPHQLLTELRKYYHGKQEEIVRAAREGQNWPVRGEEYDAARHISEGFGFLPDRPGHQHSLLLTLMILSFRRREDQALPWSEINKDFADCPVSECFRFSQLEDDIPPSMAELREWQRLISVAKSKLGHRPKL